MTLYCQQVRTDRWLKQKQPTDIMNTILIKGIALIWSLNGAPLICLDKVFHSLNATEIILNDLMLNFQIASEKLFIDLLPYMVSVLH